MPRLTRAALVASLKCEFPDAVPMTDMEFMERASFLIRYLEVRTWAALALHHPLHVFYRLRDGRIGFRYGTDGPAYSACCDSIRLG